MRYDRRVNTQNDLIGKRIRAARERLGMNQSELARKANVTASYLNRTERGLFQAPSVEKLTAIATALGMRLADLTGEAEPLDEDVAAQLERLAPDDRKLVAEAIDEVLRLAPERRREAISWIVASLQAARRVFG